MSKANGNMSEAIRNMTEAIGKKRVLFLCIGNSCRSQMAQGFARRYGSDVMTCESAGLAPATIVQPMTKKVMQEKNISIDDQYPKDVAAINIRNYDLIVNISGAKLPDGVVVPVRDWLIEDPIGRPEEVYVAVRDRIEMAVMQLILEMRRDNKRRQPPARRVRNAPAAVSHK